MTYFGPFSVNPAQVAGLGGANFNQLVGRLLAVEAAAHNMAGTTLETTYLENVGDGGVDAGLRDVIGTAWLPAGASAWQFKAGNLSPAACKSELERASWAIKILRGGGSYRLVLGASLPASKIEPRRKALLEAAAGLGIANAETKIDVIAGDQLARWIEAFPALAVSPLLRATGIIGQTFEQWSQSIRHTTSWVSSPERDHQIDAIRTTLTTGSQLDLHLDGESGLGKTRLALEALRGQPYEPIVVYSGAADSFPVTVLTELQAQKRSAVVVIDECDRKQHEIYAQALTTGTGLRLVTIGEPGGSSTRSPMISLQAFGDESMAQLLSANRPSLSPEAGRVVVQVAAGNIDYALKLSHLVIDGGLGSAGSLVTEDDLRAFFTDQLPSGQLFLGSCALAMFSRIGFDGDPASEIDAIAAGLDLAAEDLRRAATELQRRGLLSKQGRFRSVGPFPVAVYLATKAWEEFGQKIVTDLLPSIDPDLTERLFRRAAEIGELDLASSAMTAVLASDGPLASLEAIGEGNTSGLLQHLAVLAPEAVTERLAMLISAASEDDLIHARGIRRDLVWALEKLAWHSTTFVTAANALLRLALAENESYGNNASGTWVEFFGTMLPGTAAAPSVRIEYLAECAASSDDRIRALCVRAARHALNSHETIMVSGEMQGGVVVEPRGTPVTYGDIWVYRNLAIDILATLTSDENLAVANEAGKRLVEVLHGVLETPANRDHLAGVIAQLSGEVITRARTEVAHLKSLFDRTDTDDGRPEALSLFEARLPPETPEERLRVLASTRTWDRETDELANQLADTARRVNAENPSTALVHQLEGVAEIPAGYAIGRAFLLLGLTYEEGVAELSHLAETANANALIGFLHGLVNTGDDAAFDRYLDGGQLPPLVALQFSVRGARTDVAIARVDRLAEVVPVAAAARVLFAWMRDADQADAARYLRRWQPRIASQEDYNAVIDFAAMQIFRKEGAMPDLDAAIADLVPLRRDFPNLGQEGWDWVTLVRRQVESRPLEVVKLLADLVESDAINAFSGSDESQLLQEAVGLAGEEGWVELMGRLELGEWRLSVSTREWLGHAADLDTAKRWVGSNVERARILANVTDPGASPLSTTIRYLLDEFGADDHVSSSLVGSYVSGMWSGNESERIAGQLEQVRAWMNEPAQSSAVKSWCRRLIGSLEDSRRDALEREAERGW